MIKKIHVIWYYTAVQTNLNRKHTVSSPEPVRWKKSFPTILQQKLKQYLSITDSRTHEHRHTAKTIVGSWTELRPFEVHRQATANTVRRDETAPANSPRIQKLFQDAVIVHYPSVCRRDRFSCKQNAQKRHQPPLSPCMHDSPVLRLNLQNHTKLFFWATHRSAGRCRLASQSWQTPAAT